MAFDNGSANYNAAFKQIKSIPTKKELKPLGRLLKLTKMCDRRI
jgi:hypothetical protein